MSALRQMLALLVVWTGIFATIAGATAILYSRGPWLLFLFLPANATVITFAIIGAATWANRPAGDR